MSGSRVKSSISTFTAFATFMFLQIYFSTLDFLVSQRFWPHNWTWFCKRFRSFATSPYFAKVLKKCPFVIRVTSELLPWLRASLFFLNMLRNQKKYRAWKMIRQLLVAKPWLLNISGIGRSCKTSKTVAKLCSVAKQGTLWNQKI